MNSTAKTELSSNAAPLPKYLSKDRLQRSFSKQSFALLNEMRRTLPNSNSLAHFVAFAAQRAPQAHGQLFQDLWALWETGSKHKGYFVEFGAGNGVRLSNTYFLETGYDWSGVVADPNPDFRAALQKSRGCTVSTKCVFSRSGESIGFLAAQYGELSRIAEIVPEDAHETSGKRREGELGEVMVETISLNDLLIQSGAPRDIDFMSVDTEGSELEILSHFDFDRWQVRALCVEHNHTPMRDQLFDLLTSRGYRRKWSFFTQFDDWYVLDR